MCSDCDFDDEPICEYIILHQKNYRPCWLTAFGRYCGDNCCGECDDPDACHSCWLSKVGDAQMYDEDFEDDLHQECMDVGCRCNCHTLHFEAMGLRLEAGVLFDYDDHPPYQRQGVFPFLFLAQELRNKVYGFAMSQDGKQRTSPYHRGTIHTALLSSCRQVYKEARHIPLSTNRLCFATPLHALNFLGFSLAPTVKDFVTSFHVEFHYAEFLLTTWNFALKQLAKMAIAHLSLTVKGSVTKQSFLGHTCFTNVFSVLKELKSLDITIGSHMITYNVRGSSPIIPFTVKAWVLL